MKRLAVSPLAALAIVAVVAGIALAQPRPEFKLGFRMLADQIPEVAGEPLEDEHHNPLNGDALQQTSKGLMVWRKADNWTAFTDGSRTWINGPFGIQERGNDERFNWEAVRVIPPPALIRTPGPRPTMAPTATPRPATPTATATPQRTYTPDVKAMDQQSGGPGVTMTALMREIDSEWARVWGWRPSRPTTVYLYFDGYRMADDLASVRGQALTAGERENVATTASGVMARDTRTGGWAILMNLGRGYGTAWWETASKAYLVHEYTHVMQRDVAGNVGPTWFLEGMAELSAYVKVPAALANSERLQYTSLASRNGSLPALRALHTSWNGIADAGNERAQVAYGASYFAVRYLADKVGGMPLLEVLRIMARGEAFEAALQAMTGYSIDRLDAEYRSIIPSP